MASPYETPTRRSRRSSVSDRARRRSSVLGGNNDSELTPSGVQILHAGVRRSGRAIALQVLGVYRYVADPALRRELPVRAAEALQRDVFDLLLSDGQMKMKAILSPALNALVWQGLVGELVVVEVDDYELIDVHDDDKSTLHSQSSQNTRSVCVIHELAPRSSIGGGGAKSQSWASSRTAPRTKILYSAGNALLQSPSAVPAELQFVAQAHIREYGTVPLAGGRMYYLSLLSDDYPADWEPLQCESLTPVSQAVPWAEWDRRRRYCTDLFTAEDRVIHTIREVNLITTKRKRSNTLQEAEDDTPPPPIVGIVHFKSGLIHVGNEHVSNPFPFTFHIVISDRDRSLEVAFFGSMAAKNFLTIQEGDVIQLQGYQVDRSQPRRAGEKPKKLFLYTHLSRGFVSHVPEKYWQLLERTELLPMRQRGRTGSEEEKAAIHLTVWLEPTYVPSSHTQRWDMAKDEAASTYFDFVGVVTFVSRMHRLRDEDGSVDSVSAVRSFRWIKTIDPSHPSEMVTRLFVNSQPTEFHAIQAGDVIMLSKLQWVDARSGDTGLEFATSSMYTTIRRNDDIEPFQVFPECAQTFELAKTLQTTGGVKTQYSAVDSAMAAVTESWLEGAGVQESEPLHSNQSMADTILEGLSMLDEKSGKIDSGDGAVSQWIPSFYPRLSVASTDYTIGIGYNYPFDEIAGVAASMDAMSHQYLRVHVALHDIRLVPTGTGSSPPEVELLVSDGTDQQLPHQAIRVRSNMLFKELELPSPLDEMVTPDAELLVRLLSTTAVASLNTAAILRSTELPQFSPLKASTASVDSPPREQEMTFEVVKAYIMKHRQVNEDASGTDGPAAGGLDIALHLYRMPHGEMDLWVDSISL